MQVQHVEDSSLLNGPNTFVKSVDHKCVSLFLDFLFWLSHMLILMPGPYCLAYCNFVISFWNQEVCVSNFVLLNIVLTIPGPLHFHVNFRSSCQFLYIYIYIGPVCFFYMFCFVFFFLFFLTCRLSFMPFPRCQASLSRENTVRRGLESESSLCASTDHTGQGEGSQWAWALPGFLTSPPTQPLARSRLQAAQPTSSKA